MKESKIMPEVPGKSIESNANEKPEYHFWEIEKLKEPTIALVKELRERIDEGEYDMLIGDDASGRIPTLVLRKIINERNKIIHLELKSKNNEIKTRFIAGTRGKSVLDLEEKYGAAIEKLKSEINKKALLVTEYMESGGNTASLVRLFEKHKLNFDVAAVATAYDRSRYKRNYLVGTHDLFVGREGIEFVPPIYNKKDLSGVYKLEAGGPHSEPFLKYPHHQGDEEGIKSELKEYIDQARKDADTLANEVLKEVWG